MENRVKLGSISFSYIKSSWLISFFSNCHEFFLSSSFFVVWLSLKISSTRTRARLVLSLLSQYLALSWHIVCFLKIPLDEYISKVKGNSNHIRLCVTDIETSL